MNCCGVIGAWQYNLEKIGDVEDNYRKKSRNMNITRKYKIGGGYLQYRKWKNIKNMCNISVFIMKNMYSLCRNVKEIVQGMCKGFPLHCSGVKPEIFKTKPN